MSITLVDTPGAANANSFCSVAYFDDYWSTRNSDIGSSITNKDMLLIAATRAIVQAFSPRREYHAATTGINGRDAFFLIHEMWTGSPATTTQKLPWPRIGMLDRNGNAIPINVNPDDLKDATCELAGQMSLSDRLLDNNTAAKGISGLKAGPISINYNANIPLTRPLPNVIMMMLVPSWLTNAYEEPARRAFFAVVS